MVDLNNPSNPHPLSFGDTMYLQCLDVSETSDNSFSVGTVLTSKLFGLPQHSSLNFDVNQNFTTTDSYNSSSSNVHTDMAVFADDEQIDEAPDSPVADLPTTGAQALRRASTMNIVRAPTPSTPAGGLQVPAIDDYANIMVGEPLSPSRSEALSSPPGTAQTAATVDLTPVKVPRHFNNTATICGDCHVTRICEMRQLENSLGFAADFGLLSDDKAMRYTSKAATLLGKWCVHSAELPNSPHKKNKHAARNAG